MPADPSRAAAPSLEDFERLVRRAFDGAARGGAAAPAPTCCSGWKTSRPDEVLDEMEIEDPYELTGLYDGVALTERSVMDQPTGRTRSGSTAGRSSRSGSTAATSRSTGW